MEINISDKLGKEIVEYCKLNDLEIPRFIEKICRNGFTIEKYGPEPKGSVKVDSPKEVSVDNEKNTIKKDIYNE